MVWLLKDDNELTTYMIEGEGNYPFIYLDSRGFPTYGIGHLIYRTDKGDGDKIILLWATGVFTVFGLGMYILLTFFYKDNSDEQTLKMLNSPTASKVEGVVSNFRRTLYHGKYADVITESFNVDSIKFSYSDAALGKFNSFSQTNNNVIFDGQKVRITYGYGPNLGQNYGVILKLEIAN